MGNNFDAGFIAVLAVHEKTTRHLTRSSVMELGVIWSGDSFRVISRTYLEGRPSLYSMILKALDSGQ